MARNEVPVQILGAGLTGMSGIKPSQGRVPSGPAPMGAADLSTVGPMARRLRDVALALDVVKHIRTLLLVIATRPLPDPVRRIM